MLKTENNIVDIKYQQTGTATAVNSLGMREMQALAYEHRDKRFLLIIFGVILRNDLRRAFFNAFRADIYKP